MANPTVTHRVVTGAAADPRALVDGPAWDDTHVVSGLENVDNTSDATKNAAVAALTNKDLTSSSNTFPAITAIQTHAATSKTTPVDADEMPLADSAATFGLKKLTWANLKATVKAYFDTLYQPVDADLTAIAGLTTGTNLVPYFIVVGVADTALLDTDGTFLANSDTRIPTQKAIKTFVGAGYQPLDSDLTAIAGLTATTDNFIVSVASAWASRTPAQVKTTLALNNVDNTSDATKNAASVALTNKTYNGLTVTSTTGTFTLTNAKTLSVSNTLTLAGTDGSTLNIGAGGTLASAAYVATGTSGATIPLLNGTNTWANAQTFTAAPVFTAQSATRSALGLVIDTDVAALLASKVKVVTFDLSTATGSGTVTTVGFRPRLVIGFAVKNGVDVWGLGATDSAVGQNAISRLSTVMFTATGKALQIGVDLSNYQTFVISSLDSDGFSYSNTKTGTPTGNAEITWVCVR